MKIIDFERKGNVVRFYLGEKTEDWGWTRPDYTDYTGKTPDWLKPSDTFYGDDWNDRPYELNAERVYDEFIVGYKDIVFNFDDVVLDPNDCNYYHSYGYSKNDMVARTVPCIVVIPESYMKENNLHEWQVDNFEYALGIDCVKKYYFGDELGE